MHANSRFIISNQTGIHDSLAACVAKHAASVFRKPLTAYSRAAFEASIAAWEKAGRPPLILDSGCGVGLSTLHLAQRHPDHFIIGIDQSADRLARQILWPSQPPVNCIQVRADLVDYWRLLLQAGIHPARHYLLYPNPWPKKHHLGRRWHGHPVFPVLVALGGHFECRSNWRIYIEECAAALCQLTGKAVAAEPYPDTADAARGLVPITPFEQKYLASGHSLWRCRSVLLPQPGQQILLAERPLPDRQSVVS
jgi:tRNA G46 methylase TrmB